jgi:hypothetical protein
MPGEINPETLDYLRTQLVGEICANVETALFRYYRNLRSAILTVLGLAGISLGWPALKSAVQDEVRQQVKQPVADAEDSVKKQQVDIDHSLEPTPAWSRRRPTPQKWKASLSRSMIPSSRRNRMRRTLRTM